MPSSLIQPQSAIAASAPSAPTPTAYEFSTMNTHSHQSSHNDIFDIVQQSRAAPVKMTITDESSADHATTTATVVPHTRNVTMQLYKSHPINGHDMDFSHHFESVF
ncbi:hypothetical protein HDU76_009050 [Blyttiomyces sp. JEL0837]|nr:hypothetical protein HDU76_009050 [Blyttiomyces sp. JEL0837]